ncbi:hypothetical protein SDRG_12096 [Saprolegnia diclina VS20]|uniref:Uncharacterized protein n=1 Tax=Saprolegnia diclina (strain VS20) TaxID=1156394 RepID=T0Q6K7_SAPDV|nr:hypothetical protein SDRG_12096 [Saprolegnia diclina VS20]EQC30246.1 hypothetical protein SDRG_12096 [Saprolegnia diclina VS20]|eukprot:XP_008616378.1 hypothetical protein SDRG_12096 [Saprolegnia diclina VS20]
MRSAPTLPTEEMDHTKYHSSVVKLSRRSSTKARHFRVLERSVRVIDLFVNVYSITAFVLTSSLFDLLLMRQGVFHDDVLDGVYDFAPLTANDHIILDLMHNATESKYMGTATAAMATRAGGNTSSWCSRIHNTLGVSYHTVYNGDGVTRRFLRYAHVNLPVSCTGWTVAPGGAVDAPRLLAVDDARRSYGHSYLNCTDPRYYLPVFGASQNLSSFRFRAGYIVAQQHYAGATYGVVTHLSKCTAIKLDNDSTLYKVVPFPDGDTNDEVNMLFSRKNVLISSSSLCCSASSFGRPTGS